MDMNYIWQRTAMGTLLFFATIGMACADDKNLLIEKTAIKLTEEYKWLAIVDLSKGLEAIVWLKHPPQAQKQQLEDLVKNSDTARPKEMQKRMKGLLCANSAVDFRTLLRLDGMIAVERDEKINIDELKKAIELLEQKRKKLDADPEKPTESKKVPVYD